MAIAGTLAAAEPPAYSRVTRPVVFVSNLIKNSVDLCQDEKYDFFATISARLMSAIISLQLKFREICMTATLSVPSSIESWLGDKSAFILI